MNYHEIPYQPYTPFWHTPTYTLDRVAYDQFSATFEKFCLDDFQDLCKRANANESDLMITFPADFETSERLLKMFQINGRHFFRVMPDARAFETWFFVYRSDNKPYKEYAEQYRAALFAHPYSVATGSSTVILETVYAREFIARLITCDEAQAVIRDKYCNNYDSACCRTSLDYTLGFAVNQSILTFVYNLWSSCVDNIPEFDQRARVYYDVKAQRFYRDRLDEDKTIDPPPTSYLIGTVKEIVDASDATKQPAEKPRFYEPAETLHFSPLEARNVLDVLQVVKERVEKIQQQ